MLRELRVELPGEEESEHLHVRERGQSGCSSAIRAVECRGLSLCPSQAPSWAGMTASTRKKTMPHATRVAARATLPTRPGEVERPGRGIRVRPEVAGPEVAEGIDVC